MEQFNAIRQKMETQANKLGMELAAKELDVLNLEDELAERDDELAELWDEMDELREELALKKSQN